MKKITISKLFLYKHRFAIGYILLGLIFTALLFTLPLFTQTGLSEAEMTSAVAADSLQPSSIVGGDLVNLPYLILQKFSILFFGLTPYAIKLPSIIIGLLLGFLIILILNRWFKNNVSLLASILVVLSTPFLFLAGSGTPLIMVVFWPALLLWLGSKIQGEGKPEAKYCFAFGFSLLLSIFTPFMIYFAIFCIIFVIFQPHLRFVIKTLPKTPLIISGIITGLVIIALGINIISRHDIIKELLFASNFPITGLVENLSNAVSLSLSWTSSKESTFLSPLISLPIFALAFIGLFSTTKGFFASRNSIATYLLIFTLIMASFNTDYILFIILPLAIVVAHGLKYVLEKWYSLFPENPYARIFALLPLSILLGLIVTPGLFQYINGYHYNPNISSQFSNDLAIIRENLTDETLLLAPDSLEYNFYKILENRTNIKVVDSAEYIAEGSAVAIYKKTMPAPENLPLFSIITSEKSDNSDIIYLYKTEQGE